LQRVIKVELEITAAFGTLMGCQLKFAQLIGEASESFHMIRI
jgi:hypothetical protein